MKGKMYPSMRRAAESMLAHYESGEPKTGLCVLCQAGDKIVMRVKHKPRIKCDICAWMLFEGISCIEWARRQHITVDEMIAWRNQNDQPTFSKMRAEMIKHWLEEDYQK